MEGRGRWIRRRRRIRESWVHFVRGNRRFDADYSLFLFWVLDLVRFPRGFSGCWIDTLIRWFVGSVWGRCPLVSTMLCLHPILARFRLRYFAPLLVCSLLVVLLLYYSAVLARLRRWSLCPALLASTALLASLSALDPALRNNRRNRPKNRAIPPSFSRRGLRNRAILDRHRA